MAFILRLYLRFW